MNINEIKMWKEAAVAYSEIILHLLKCLIKASALTDGPTEYESLQQAVRGFVRHLKAEAARHRVAIRGLASSIGSSDGRTNAIRHIGISWGGL